MELEDFIGIHELSGVEITVENINPHSRNKYAEDCQVIKFILDGKKYIAYEDPEDDYRSACDDIDEYYGEIKNIFPPQKVICRMHPNLPDSYHNILQMFDAFTNNLVLEVGTIDWGRYPCCEMVFNPENMAINAGSKYILKA